MDSPKAPLVLHLVHSLEGGGTERVLVSLLKAFDHRVIRHTVVTQRCAGTLAAQSPEEVACIPLQAQGRTYATGLRLARLCRRLQPTILHARNVNTWGDALVAQILCPSIKLVLGFHGLQAGGRFGIREKIMGRIASALGAQFTSVSLRAQRQMAHELGLRVEKIQHLPNGIDFGCLKPTENRNALRANFGYSGNEITLGIVGSLTPVKGHGALLSAFARAAANISALRLIIIGDGPLRPDLEETARRLNVHDRVKFLGHRDDLPAILPALDAYVCASHSEGMSNALMEAMTAGLPVITTDVGDHSLLVRDGVDGLVVSPDDVTALSGAIQAMVTSRVSQTMGQNAKQRILAFCFDKTAQAYQSFYAGLTSRSTNRFASLCRRVSKSVTLINRPRVPLAGSVK